MDILNLIFAVVFARISSISTTIANFLDPTLTDPTKAAPAKATGDALATKWNISDTDNTPTENSTKLITSGGVYASEAEIIEDLKLLMDEIPDTVQSYTFSGGAVSQVTHTQDNTVIRTDAFTYETSTITEVRTLNTGESLTITTNLITLETTVTYVAA